MPTKHNATAYGLSFEVTGVSSTVAVSVNAASYLHAEDPKVTANKPFAVCLCVDVPRDRAHHVVLGFGSCRSTFAMYVLHVVIHHAL